MNKLFFNNYNDETKNNRGEKKSPQKKCFNLYKKNTINSINDVECFLNNFNHYFKYFKLYKIFKK